MSFEQWKQIRDNASVNCDVAMRAVEAVNGIQGAALSLADEYNVMLFEDFTKIATFIDSENLWPQLNAGNLPTTWQRIKNKNERNVLGDKLSGIAAKFAAIQLLVSKLDQIYTGERGFVDRTLFAFSLLNRKLFLLSDLRARWLKAFEKNTEPVIEKLGGLHLFECGIWAFKVGGQHEETDLILDQGLESSGERIPLVMTEWKKVGERKEADQKIAEAVKQCGIYADGVARPLQVKGHRFIVLVSKKPLNIDKEFDEGGKRYIIRNIAIERMSPSKEARRKDH